MPVCGKCEHAHVTVVVGDRFAHQYECGIKEHDQSTKCPDRKWIAFVRPDGDRAIVMIGADQVIDMSNIQFDDIRGAEPGDIVQCDETEDVYQFLKGAWVDVTLPFEARSNEADTPTFNIDIAGSW